MGKLFLSNIGGKRIYCCASCDTPLTNQTELMSTRFTGSTGRAYLFKNAVNIVFSNIE
ncbi:hypothetical protein A3Q56_05287, partial [Intoshia linei]